MVSKRYYNIYNLVLLLNNFLLQLTLVAAKVTTRSTTTTAGGYASSSSVDDTKPTVSTKYHGLNSVKTTASKRIKTNQLQLSATQLENNDSSNLLANSSPVVLVNSRVSRTTTSLKRSRDSPTTNESQEQFFGGIAFPRRTTQEEITSSSTAETTKLRAEIEELKKSVQALCASNKTLLESQAVKTQMIIDSDSGRSHRSTAARPREIPKKQATVEGPPAVEQKSSMPKFANKGAGEFSVSSSDEQSSVSSSPVSSRHTSRKQRRSCYMEMSRY